MSTVRALVNADVFACHCKFEDSCIQVGILTLSDEFQPGLHFLYCLNTKQRYSVLIPSAISPQYKVKLNYGSSIHNA